jgi:hypothetical protein
MASWPVDAATSEVDWESYRLKHASLEEQAAAGMQPESPHQAAIAEPARKRTAKTDG